MRLAVAAIAVASVAALADSASAAPVFIVSGGGNGHGVGMSQYGAEGFAVHGYRYQTILAHYFPGTRLARWGNPPVRVLLATGRSRVAIGSAGLFRAVDATGRSVRFPAGEHAFTRWNGVRVHGRPRMLRLPLRIEAGTAPLRIDGASYRGSLTLLDDSGDLDVVNTLPLESYLLGVVPAEMPFFWSREALATQAVAARSYALARRKPDAAFDVYPDQRSQMYEGIRAERSTTDAAVARTAGEVLTWRGAVAETYYSSSSGGRTEANEDAWPGARPIPYLRSVSDPFDTISPYHRWRPLVLGAGTLGQRLGLAGVGDVQVVAAPSGWARSVRVRTASGTRTIAADAFARRLGLRSTAFRVGALDLHADDTHAVYGGRVLLRGLLRGLHGMHGSLESRRPGGAWHAAPLPSAGGDGDRWLLVRPVRTTEYRLAAGSVSTTPVRIAVSPRVVVARDRHQLSGSVRPALGGLRVAIQRRLAGSWLTIRRARLREAGDFSLDRDLPPGTYRATIEPTSGLAAAFSSPIRVP